MVVSIDKTIQRDVRTLARFIEIHCRGQHADQPRDAVQIRDWDIDPLVGRPARLCHACRKLLMHALVKRIHCPMDPKPACKHCPRHCYHPEYRAQIRRVMAYSGRKLVLTGRLDYLWHLLF